MIEMIVDRATSTESSVGHEKMDTEKDPVEEERTNAKSNMIFDWYW